MGSGWFPWHVLHGVDGALASGVLKFGKSAAIFHHDERAAALFPLTEPFRTFPPIRTGPPSRDMLLLAFLACSRCRE